MIREIKFTVNESTVTPNARQFAGVAGEHNATQLSFTIEKALLEKIQQQAVDGKELKYRFDCFDSCGALYSTKPDTFTGGTVILPLGENITHLGGEAKIVLVVTLLNAESKTEMELLSVPVSVYFKGVPFASGKLDESHESLTALEQSAKLAAQKADDSAQEAKTSAQEAATQKISAEEMLATHNTAPDAHLNKMPVFGKVQILKYVAGSGYVYVEPESVEEIKNPVVIDFGMDGDPKIKPKSSRGKIEGFDYGGGSIYGKLSMLGNSITQLPAPVELSDAANKMYVDDQIGQITSILSTLVDPAEV